MRVTVDLQGVEKLQRDLQTMRRRALPHAMRNALNDEAFAARKVWQSDMGKAFTLRNRWTAGSVRVEKARGINIGSMQAVTGSLAPYVAEQEFGATVQKEAIPTGAASGEGRIPGSQRKRQVRRPNLKRNIKLGPRVTKGSRHVRLAGTIAAAKRGGHKFVFLELGRGGKRGIFRLSGRNGNRLRMVYDLSRNSITKRATPTLEPAVGTVRKWAPGIVRRAMIAQFKRAGLQAWL